eukprot:5902036-Amphidinium_carterae.2
MDTQVVGEPAPTVYRVGDHLCVITDGGICMKCRHCSRYVTSYKATWRNLGTLRKQPCKPKKAKKGKAGKAPQQQKGGALPALPPGSLTRAHDREPAPETLASLHKQIQSEFGTAELDAEASGVLQGEPVRKSGNTRGNRGVPSHLPDDQEQLVCMHCLPVVVYDGVQFCGLGCGISVCARHAHSRTIRDQIVIVCRDCITEHPEQLPKNSGGTPSAAVPFLTTANENRRRICAPFRRQAEE